MLMSVQIDTFVEIIAEAVQGSRTMESCCSHLDLSIVSSGCDVWECTVSSRGHVPAIITSCLSHFGQSLAFRYRHQALVYQFLDTFMASMLPIELTVHSQTSHPLDNNTQIQVTTARFHRYLLPCTASAIISTKCRSVRSWAYSSKSPIQSNAVIGSHW